jgi:DNA-binding NarL/FixJ family response regulator
VGASESLEAWCTEITRAAAPIFARRGGVGCLASVFREGYEPYLHLGLDPLGIVDTLATRIAAAPRAVRERCFSGFRVSHVAARFGRRSLVGWPLWEPLERAGMVDAVGMLGGGTHGVVLSTPYGRGGFDATRWAELLTMQRHLQRAAGARCALKGPADADAVVNDNGKVVSLGAGDTRPDAIRAAVAALERARRGRAAEREGAELWEGVLRGEWSCVEHIEHDGKRLMLLHRRASRRERLTPAESAVVERARRGLSGKRIALELGVGQPTVSTHLRAALVKLGFESRNQLVRFTGSAGVAREAKVR